MTISNLYKLLQEGKISKEKWMYEVRRDQQLPWVTNLTSYDDSIRILKQKSIIKESEQPNLKTGDYVAFMKGSSHYNGKILSIDTVRGTAKVEFEFSGEDVKEDIPLSKLEKTDNALDETNYLDINEGGVENLKARNPKAFEAAQTILNYETLPPQIDYVSPAKKKKVHDANEYLESLPEDEQKAFYGYIKTQIDKYYGPNGAAQYDDLFEKIKDPNKFELGDEDPDTVPDGVNDKAPSKPIKDKESIKSVLTKIVQKVWSEKNLDTAKKMVIDFVSQSQIKDEDKKKILTNLKPITTKLKLDMYLANSLLGYEGHGMGQLKKEAEEPKGIQSRADGINTFAKMVKNKEISDEDLASDLENIRDFPDGGYNITYKEAVHILKKYNRYENVIKHINQDNDTDPAGGSGLHSHMEAKGDFAGVSGRGGDEVDKAKVQQLRADAINKLAKQAKDVNFEDERLAQQYIKAMQNPDNAIVTAEEMAKILKKYDRWDSMQAAVKQMLLNGKKKSQGKLDMGDLLEGDDFDITPYIDLAAQYTDKSVEEVADRQFNNAYEAINVIKDYIPGDKQQEFLAAAAKIAGPNPKDNLDENKNKDEYQFYLFDTKEKKIISGWEDQMEAFDARKDKHLNIDTVKIYTGRVLQFMGFDPSNEKNWRNEDVSENLLQESKKEDKKDLTGLLYKKNRIPQEKEKTADDVIFAEYQRGIQYELEKQGDLDLDKAMKKALSNLSKDNLFYTRILSGQSKKDMDTLQKPVGSMEEIKAKGDNKASNQMDTVGKKSKETANDSLNKKERKKAKNGKKIKILTHTPHKQKGVKVMDMPGKEKKIKLKEGEDKSIDNNAFKVWISDVMGHFTSHYGFEQEEAYALVKNNLKALKDLFRRKYKSDEAFDNILSFSSTMNENPESTTEDLYKDTKSGAVQSFNPNDPTDKKTLNDPKFRIRFKRDA